MVVFTSATCQSCAAMAGKAAVLASAQVAVDVVEVTEPARRSTASTPSTPCPSSSWPTRRGVVGASFIGPASATDLWAAVAEVRQPGSSPEPDLG